MTNKEIAAKINTLRKEANARPAYAPSTAVSPTVAIHHGDHGTYEPAGTTIEQNSQQQTFKQTVI